MLKKKIKNQIKSIKIRSNKFKKSWFIIIKYKKNYIKLMKAQNKINTTKKYIN